METVYLTSSIVLPNCSRILWCIRPETSVNKIQRLILKYDMRHITCGDHAYIFIVDTIGTHSAKPFSFNETDMLMELLPNESNSFYLKAALREFINTFTVFNSKDARVYPEDIV